MSRKTPATILALAPLLISLAFSRTTFAADPSCFLLLNLKSGKIEKEVGGEFCNERVFACSTFKIPLALMAFDRGILKDENSGFKWDGKPRQLEAWNKDHTAASWIKDSVIWFSQTLTPALGMDTIKKYLAAFEYGNQDMSGGLTEAWLSSSLKLSAHEQVRFWKKLWTGEVPVSKHALETTRKITQLEALPSGATLDGKTGSGFAPDYRIGWFAGHLKNGDREYVFAYVMKDQRKPVSSSFAGGEAKARAKELLKELGLL